MLSVRINFIAAFGFLDHRGIVSVTGRADIQVSGGLDLIVGSVAGLAFHPAGDMAVS